MSSGLKPSTSPGRSDYHCRVKEGPSYIENIPKRSGGEALRELAAAIRH